MKRSALHSSFCLSVPLLPLLFLLLLLSSSLPSSNAFANWMTTDFCRRSMQVGEVIMGEEVVLSPDRQVQVFRDGRSLESGKDSFILGEVLTVKVSEAKDQFVFEVSGSSEAKFLGPAGCEGKRIADKAEVQLKVPIADLSQPLAIVVAWAEGHTTVKVSSPFILPPPSGDHSSSSSSSSSGARERPRVKGPIKLNLNNLPNNLAKPVKTAPVPQNLSVESETDSNLRKRPQGRHEKSTDRAVDPELSRVIDSHGDDEAGAKDWPRKKNPFSPPTSKPKRRRFKDMKYKVLYRAALYIGLIAVVFFTVAFLIRYRHNIHRQLMKSLGYKPVEK